MTCFNIHARPRCTISGPILRERLAGPHRLCSLLRMATTPPGTSLASADDQVHDFLAMTLLLTGPMNVDRQILADGPCRRRPISRPRPCQDISGALNLLAADMLACT